MQLRKNVENLNKKSKLARFFHKTKTNTEGATAVEFAMLGIPFAALLFGIIELSVLFFMQSTVQHAMSEVAREIRTGEFQMTGGGADEFKAAVCAQMQGVGNCNRLRIDVVSSLTGKFTNLNLPPPIPQCTGTQAQIDACLAAPPVMPPSTYANTGSSDVVIVRVQYVHPLTIPSALTRLANAQGNTHVITSTTAFKNEPF